MQAYEIVGADGIDALQLADRPTPEPGPGEVLVRMRASSLNYRDLMTSSTRTAARCATRASRIRTAPARCSRSAPGVTRFTPGDRVAGIFFQRWVDGPITADAMASALGGAVDGVLAEEVVLDEGAWCRSRRTCRSRRRRRCPAPRVTAWHALVAKGRLKAGETVLLLGTGGVSIFALQFAALHGARVDRHLEQRRQAGARAQRSAPGRRRQLPHDARVGAGGAGADRRRRRRPRRRGRRRRHARSARSRPAASAGTIALIGVLTGGADQPDRRSCARRSPCTASTSAAGRCSRR